MSNVMLVPLDGSPLAERALPYATRVAAATGAKLVLVRAAIGYFAPTEDPVEVQLKAVQDAESYLKARADETTGQSQIAVETAVPYGRAALGILDEIKIRDASLVVMATHGRGGIGRMVYGSVAEEVLQHATVPVLMIPSTCERPWSIEQPLRILVPIERSEQSLAIIGTAEALAERLGAELLLMHVVELPTQSYAEGYAYVPYDLQAEKQAAEAELEKIAGKLRATGRSVQTKVTVGFPVSEIADAAHADKADLVVMATHARTGLARLVIGSVAMGTLHRAGLPIYLVPPAAQPRETAEPTEPAAEPIAPEPVGASPLLTLALDRSEIDLIERGLSDLLFAPQTDQAVARSARDLLRRVRGAEAAVCQAEPSAV